MTVLNMFYPDLKRL